MDSLIFKYSDEVKTTTNFIVSSKISILSKNILLLIGIKCSFNSNHSLISIKR